MRLARTAGLVLAAGALAAVPGTAAAAPTEQVTVFQTELQSLKTFENPSGCHQLPPGSHVLANQTDEPVRIYGDPFCVGPSVTIPPGHGSHVAPGSGSFSA